MTKATRSMITDPEPMVTSASWLCPGRQSNPQQQQRMRPDNGVVQRLTKRITDQSGTNPNSKYTCCYQKNTGKVHQ